MRIKEKLDQLAAEEVTQTLEVKRDEMVKVEAMKD